MKIYDQDYAPNFIIVSSIRQEGFSAFTASNNTIILNNASSLQIFTSGMENCYNYETKSVTITNNNVIGEASSFMGFYIFPYHNNYAVVKGNTITNVTEGFFYIRSMANPHNASILRGSFNNNRVIEGGANGIFADQLQPGSIIADEWNGNIGMIAPNNVVNGDEFYARRVYSGYVIGNERLEIVVPCGFWRTTHKVTATVAYSGGAESTVGMSVYESFISRNGWSVHPVLNENILINNTFNGVGGWKVEWHTPESFKIIKEPGTLGSTVKYLITVEGGLLK